MLITEQLGDLAILIPRNLPDFIHIIKEGNKNLELKFVNEQTVLFRLTNVKWFTIVQLKTPYLVVMQSIVVPQSKR